jgi:hypothetical protein
MGPWLRLVGLFAGIVVAVLLLKVLHPLIVLAMLIGGIVYLNHVLTVKPKREGSRTTAELLGLEPMPDGSAEILAYPFALLGRAHALVRDVMVGPWRGVQVHLFDLETTSSMSIPGSDGVRRWSCVLAPLPLETPHLVAEPLAFLTAEPDRPNLAVCTVESPRLASAFDVRSEDPAFASAFLRDGVADRLLEQEDRIAVETRSRMVLLYGPAIPAKDRDVLLGTLHGFLDAVARRGE